MIKKSRISIFWAFSLIIIYHFFYSTNLHHGQGNWSFLKYNILKLLTSTLKKPVLSSSDAHTSSASNLTQTSISSQLDNKDITTNQNKNNTSNTDDIHSCVTPRKRITVFSPHLQPLILRHWMLHCILRLLSYAKQLNYSSLVKYICVFWLTKK